jgi:hypothetical protein
MNRITKIITGLGLVTAIVAPSVASAQQWQTINSRQANIEKRIDQGVRSGALNRREATQLRTDFRSLTRLEARYRVNGLSMSERRDLDRRYDALSKRVKVMKVNQNGHHGRR